MISIEPLIQAARWTERRQEATAKGSTGLSGLETASAVLMWATSVGQPDLMVILAASFARRFGRSLLDGHAFQALQPEGEDKMEDTSDTDSHSTPAELVNVIAKCLNDDDRKKRSLKFGKKAPILGIDTFLQTLANPPNKTHTIIQTAANFKKKLAECEQSEKRKKGKRCIIATIGRC